MKKICKNNLKTVLVAAVTAIICISGTAFAAYEYNAKQVEYKDGKSVETALNELYIINNTQNTLYIENAIGSSGFRIYKFIFFIT